MVVLDCNSRIAPDKKELVRHGTAAFPVGCYNDDMRKDEVPWHWHEELEAGVIAQGRVRLAVGARSLTLEAGQGFFINSQVLHGCWDAGGGVIHSLVFHPRLVGGSIDSVFYQDYVQPLVENAALEHVILLPETPWHAQAMEHIARAWGACAQESAGYEFRVRAELSELVAALLRNSPAVQAQPSARALRNGERIKQMLQYIHTHFAEPLDTGAIAQAAAVSESECLRCFRDAIGTTPIQYVRQYRVQAAARLLAESGEKTAAIAAQCGFQDVSYFTKTFRQLKGCTPAAYRRRKGMGLPSGAAEEKEQQNR